MRIPWNKGLKWSDEIRQKISDALKNGGAEKISNSRMGMKFSKEHLLHQGAIKGNDKKTKHDHEGNHGR